MGHGMKNFPRMIIHNAAVAPQPFPDKSFLMLGDSDIDPNA
jgi:hypothetical protein